MYTIITIIHVLACIFLVLVVLLQTGKGADMGAVFGGSSSTVFGSSGAGNFLTRLTTATAIIFMFTSMSLTYLSARRTTATVFDAAPVAAPVVPAAPAPDAAQSPNPGAPVPPAAPAAQPQAAEPQAAAEPAPAAEGNAPPPAP